MLYGQADMDMDVAAEERLQTPEASGRMAELES